MKIKFLSLSLLSLFFISCGGDDSSSSSQEGFFCNVTKQKGLVKQEFQIPGVFDGSVEVSVKNGEASIVTRKTFFGFSKAEMDEICDELEYDLGEDLDNGKATAECGGNSLYVSQKMSSKSLGSPSDVAAEMQEECDEYEEDWLEYSEEKSSSSSEKKSSSSSEKKSSSSSEKKSSSSSKPASSSSEEPESSSSEFVRVYHDGDFDGMTVAPDAFADDDSTLYFEDFGGKVLCLYDDSVYNTNFLMEEDLPSGKLEFFFRPHEDFFRASRVLIGNDGARLLVYYDGTNLVLMMNKNNVFRYVKKPAEILNDWNYVQVIWADDRAALYLNNEIVGETELEGGYESSDRSWEHELVIGQKSSCCMSGAGMNAQMRTSADFGPVRISIPKVVEEDSSSDEELPSENSDDELLNDDSSLEVLPSESENDDL